MDGGIGSKKCRRARLGFKALLASAVALVSVACSGGADAFGEEIGMFGQELRCHDGYGNPHNDPNCPWKSLSRLVPFESENDIGHRSSPAVCAGDGSTLLTVSVDPSNRYRTLQSHWFGAPEWGWYGSRTFASKPACTLRESDASGRVGFVLAGKGTDNRIYASAGIMQPGGLPQENPIPAGPFAPVSQTTYTTGGAPALSTGGFVESVVMVFMGDDRRVYAHHRAIPYLSNSWSQRVSGPQLPAGWTPVGAPTIIRLPITQQIFVLARNGAQDRLFETHFFIPPNGSAPYFSNFSGYPVASFVMLPSLGRIDSEPAATFSNVHGTTLYFRRYEPATQTSQIMQTGGYPLGSNPILPVRPLEGINFTGAPAAVANWAFESQNGTHTVVARTTSNQLYMGVSNGDHLVVP